MQKEVLARNRVISHSKIEDKDTEKNKFAKHFRK